MEKINKMNHAMKNVLYFVVVALVMAACSVGAFRQGIGASCPRGCLADAGKANMLLSWRYVRNIACCQKHFVAAFEGIESSGTNSGNYHAANGKILYQ